MPTGNYSTEGLFPEAVVQVTLAIVKEKSIQGNFSYLFRCKIDGEH